MTSKKTTQRQGFRTNEFIVYPSHGVGQILAIEEQEVAGAKLELFVINFVKDKMTLRVPTAKIATVGMRKLAEPPLVRRALETLKGRARVKRTMWSRRAQEYEAKINSGDIVAIAEVVRDLFRSESQPEQSTRNLGGAAHHRDRSDQGDRSGAGQGPPPRSQARRRRRRRRGGGGGGGLSIAAAK
jgi:CarD family transcriptional regulator